MTTAKLPREMWGMNGPWRVVLVDSLPSAPGEGEVYGEMDPKDRVLRIRRGMHPSQARMTLYHEWVHAILWDTGVTNGLNDDAEEALCNALGSALAAMLGRR